MHSARVFPMHTFPLLRMCEANALPRIGRHTRIREAFILFRSDSAEASIKQIGETK